MDLLQFITIINFRSIFSTTLNTTEGVSMINRISELSDDNLVRLFFKKLWQGYDSGGVSIGRSLRSSLVEVYLAICEDCEDEMVRNLQIGLREIAEEADRRASPKYRQMVLCSGEDASILPSVLIALLCIEGLHNWYNIHQGEENSEGYIANPFEYRFISSVHKIMPIPFFPGLNSDAEIKILSQIGKERVRIKFGTHHP